MPQTQQKGEFPRGISLPNNRISAQLTKPSHPMEIKHLRLQGGMPKEVNYTGAFLDETCGLENQSSYSSQKN
jgi:hypothetical protein